MKSNRAIHYKGFPDGIWQILWYGDLGYDASDLQSQPKIALVLQSLDAHSHARKRIRVPLSFITLVPLGSIWEDGERVVKRPDAGLQSRKVDVFPGRVEETKAGSLVDADPTSSNLLPFGAFDFHRHDTGTPCLRWTTPAGEIIVLPTMEIIRFYFGTSSFLLRRIVTGRPPLDALWEALTLDPETKDAQVHLAADVPRGKSPRESARIAFDPMVRRAADRVHRSLGVAAGAGAAIHPRMTFPFTKPSTLRVAGVQLPGVHNPPRFVVLRIDSCTASYPFNDLTITGGKDVKEADVDDASEADRIDQNRQRGVSIGSGEPTTGRTSRSEARWEGHRFVDLARKKLHFATLAEAAGNAGGGQPANDGAFGLGDGISSGSGAPLEIGVFASPSSLAFIDYRLISDLDPIDQWEQISHELEHGNPPIHPILIAEVRPEWAIGFSGDACCEIACDATHSSTDGAAIACRKFRDWILAHHSEANQWRAFTPEVVRAETSQWTTIRPELDLATTVRGAFDIGSDDCPI